MTAHSRIGIAAPKPVKVSESRSISSGFRRRISEAGSLGADALGGHCARAAQRTTEVMRSHYPSPAGVARQKRKKASEGKPCDFTKDRAERVRTVPYINRERPTVSGALASLSAHTTYEPEPPAPPAPPLPPPKLVEERNPEFVA